MGVGRSAEGLAPRPPPGRGRKNRKRRRISPAESHGRNPPRPSNQPPTPDHPPTRAERGRWMKLRQGRPQVHDVFSARATPHQVQTYRQDSLRPVCHLFNLFFLPLVPSPRYAKDTRRDARPQLPGGEGGQSNVEGLKRRQGIIHSDVASAVSRAAPALFSLGGGRGEASESHAA